MLLTLRQSNATFNFMLTINILSIFFCAFNNFHRLSKWTIVLGFTYLFKQNKITFVVDKIKCYKIFRTRLLLFVFPCSKNINHYVKNQVWIVMDHMVLTFHKSVVLCHPRRDYSIFAETIDFRKGSYLLFTLMSKRRDWNQLILWKVLQSLPSFYFL